MPTQNSTPDERAQTEQLNTDAANPRAQQQCVQHSGARQLQPPAKRLSQRHDRAATAAGLRPQHGALQRRWHRHHGEAMDVGFDFGTIAFGYNDGYWDNGHRWHAWRNSSDAHMYQSRYRNSFHNWRHDRGNDGSSTAERHRETPPTLMKPARPAQARRVAARPRSPADYRAVRDPSWMIAVDDPDAARRNLHPGLQLARKRIDDVRCPNPSADGRGILQHSRHRRPLPRGASRPRARRSSPRPTPRHVCHRETRA